MLNDKAHLDALVGMMATTSLVDYQRALDMDRQAALARNDRKSAAFCAHRIKRIGQELQRRGHPADPAMPFLSIEQVMTGDDRDQGH